MSHQPRRDESLIFLPLINTSGYSNMKFRDYLLAIAKKAIMTPWRLSETIASTIGILGALITWLLPKTTSYVHLATWAIPLSLLAPLTLYRFILAPYWLLKEEKVATEKYRQNLAEIEKAKPNVFVELNLPSPTLS